MPALSKEQSRVGSGRVPATAQIRPNRHSHYALLRADPPVSGRSSSSRRLRPIAIITPPRGSRLRFLNRKETLMRRLTLLLLALSLAVVAPVAHAAPLAPGGPTAHAAQAPGDRDGDGFPDTFDQCPDAPGPIAGCPRPADRDGDAYPDA